MTAQRDACKRLRWVWRGRGAQVLKDRPPQPSNFCLKLRKHVRTRRLEDVRQLGVDRIVDFTFGTGAATVHIILELYSSVPPTPHPPLLSPTQRSVALGALHFTAQPGGQ